MTSISDRLKLLRSQKGVNQDVVAEACNMSRIALARYETGARIPRSENAARLADYYGVTVDYILGREEAQSPAQEKAPGTIDDQIMRELEGADVELLRETLNFIRFRKQGGN